MANSWSGNKSEPAPLEERKTTIMVIDCMHGPGWCGWTGGQGAPATCDGCLMDGSRVSPEELRRRGKAEMRRRYGERHVSG